MYEYNQSQEQMTNLPTWMKIYSFARNQNPCGSKEQCAGTGGSGERGREEKRDLDEREGETWRGKRVRCIQANK